MIGDREGVDGLGGHGLTAGARQREGGAIGGGDVEGEGHAPARHILIRFAGARNAPPEITRTRDEARAAIDAVRAELVGGADFQALARARSEDGSSERGGDVGTRGRGRMAEAYEMAAYALAEQEISVVVETEFGFHVIQRLPL